MKNRLTLFGFLLILAGCCGCADGDSPAPSSALPQSVNVSPSTPLSFEPSSLDLPQLIVNASYSFSLHVHNTGHNRVVVKRVSAGCACTDVEISQSILDPQDSALISGVFRAGREPGESIRHVAVETEAAGTFEVPLRATVVRSLVWSPDPLILQPDILTGHAAEGRFEIASTIDGDFELKDATCESPDLIANIRQSRVSESQKGVVQVRAPAAWLTRRTLVLRCLLNGVGEELELPIQVKPINYLEADPPSIHLGVMNPDGLAKRDIKVRVRGTLLEQVRFQHVECPGFLTCKSVVSRSKPELAFVFRGVSEHAGTGLQGSIRFTFLLNADELSVTVPVWGIIDTGHTESLRRRLHNVSG